MNRWLTFAVALVTRCAVAFVFFGSWDVVSTAIDAGKLIGGLPPSGLRVPYLPGLQLIFWTFGLIDFHTAIPTAFLYKFSGCLFDAVIAAMIADVRGRRAGLLYAFAPVSILVFSIHGQWDSISLAPFIAGMLLLRREGPIPAAGAGALYVLSVIVKPITVPFLVFFVERKRVVPLLAGAAATTGAYMLVLWAIGDPLTPRLLAYVLDYIREGVAHLGLPVGLGVKPNRFVTLLPLLLLVPLYWKGRISREAAIAIGYAFILGTSGLAAQYLSWLLPFLPLCGHERFGALYGSLSALYLALANATIGYDGLSYEARRAFAPLHGLEWLTPGVGNIDLKVILLGLLGDFAIPLACLAFAVYGVRRHHLRFPIRANQKAEVPPPHSTAPLAAALVVVFALFVLALSLPRPTREQFQTRFTTKTAAYASFAPPAKERPVDALTIAYLWITAWAIAAARGAAARDRPAT